MVQTLTGVFGALHFSVFQNSNQNALLRIKLAGAERLQREYAQINDKFDGSASKSIEESINKLAEKKDALAEVARHTASGLKDIDSIRDQLVLLRNAAAAGDTTQFDNAITASNSVVGKQSTDPNNLLAKAGNGQGIWYEPVKAFDLNGLTGQVQHRFAGSDYNIELSDGSWLQPHFPNQNLADSAGSTIDFANLQLDDLTGDAITFTDTSTATQYTGTVHRGGGEVLSSWAYNNFATQTDIDNAVADVDNWVKRLATIERELMVSETMLQSQVDSLTNKLQVKTDEYVKVSNADVDEKEALKAAAKMRHDLRLNSLALTAGGHENMIQSIFNSPMNYEKKSLFQILGGN